MMEVFTSPSQRAKESARSGNSYSIMLPDQVCNLNWKDHSGSPHNHVLWLSPEGFFLKLQSTSHL